MRPRLASMDTAAAKRKPVGGGDMDTSETINGMRERASVEGVIDSEIPTQLLGKRYRAGDTPLACVADKEVVKEHAQWRRFEMYLRGLLKNATALWGRNCRRRPNMCRRTLRGRRRRGNRTHGSSSQSIHLRNGALRPKCAVADLEEGGCLIWKEVDGKKPAEERLFAKGYQDPDIRNGNVDVAGCVGRRSLHLRLESLSALAKWKIWSLDTKNALLDF